MSATLELPVHLAPGGLGLRAIPRQMALPQPRRNSLGRLTSITILAWIVRAAAMINLLALSRHHIPGVIYMLSNWAPFEISAGQRVLMLLTAILLFILSSGLERGKRTAWLLTIGALAFTPFLHLGRAVIWPQLLLNLPLVLLLVANRRFFVAGSDGRALRSALIICPALLVGLLLYGTIRLHDLRFETSGPDSWGGCLQAAGELVLVQNAHTQHAQTHNSLVLFSVLRVAGTSIALLGLFLTLRPALAPRTPSAEERARMRSLIQSYGHDPLNAFALLDDKYFFFSLSSVAIPYVVSSRFAVVLADPVGPPAALAAAISEFVDFCRYQDWAPLFHQVCEETLPVYRTLGFSCLKIGEDARIETESFDLKGSPFQNLRTLCNKARKLGIQFCWYDASIRPDEELEAQLSHISKAWLDRKNGNEMTFDMSSFSRDEIRRKGTAVALDAEGRALAFATWRPFNRGEGMVLDLMRALPEARNVLDFVLIESINHFRAGGISEISLGNAPLANASEEYRRASVEDLAVRFIYENLNHVYAYKPLFEFKRKYRPQWRSRYLAYPGSEPLPLIGLALVRVHTRQGPWKFFTG